MGLLDSLFDPQTYGGDGGLLSRLQPMLGALPQSQGFTPQPSNPIGIGGYQMPRIGNPDLYDPQQVSLPPNAQPTQGQAPVGMQQPAQQMQLGLQQPTPQTTLDQSLPPALGGGGYLNRVKAGGSLIGSLFSGSPQQENLKAQYDALVPVVGPQKALLAVMNPEAGKTILTEALTNKNEVKDVQDAFGGHHLMWVNPLKPGVAVGVNGGSGGGAEGTSSPDLGELTAKINAAREAGASRQQLLQMVPDAYRSDVDGLTSYKLSPANLGRAAARGALITLAGSVDPTFDTTKYPTAVQVRKDFSGEGKNGQAIIAFNTAQHHIDQASDALEDVAKYRDAGGNYPLLNQAQSYFANNYNTNPKLRDALTTYNTKITAADHEIQQAYNAGHITDADRATWERIKNSDAPPDVQRKYLAAAVDLLNGKRDALNNIYKNTFGTDAPSIEKDTNAATTKKIQARANGTQGAAQPASSGLPAGWSIQVR